MKTILKKLKKIYVEEFDGDGSIFEIDCTMDELNLDSLETYELIMAIEEQFDVDIPETEAESFRTVRDVVEYISNNSATLDEDGDEDDED